MYHIIIADDTDSIRSIAARVVARTYTTVRISSVIDGLDALRIFEQEGADLIITNNEMIHLDGLELVRRLRAKNSTVPIIMMSGNRALQVHAQAAGVDRFVPKPFTIAQLTQVLLELLPA